MIKKSLLLLLLLSLFKQLPAQTKSTRIDWDKWGVPHIIAATERDLFFAQGWAEMQAHANLVLKLYGISRGKAAAYWGKDFESADRLIHQLDLSHIAINHRRQQTPQLKQIIKAFADGMNAYAKAHPEAIDTDRRMVLPVTPDDIDQQSMFFMVIRSVGQNAFDIFLRWEDVGSNAAAIAPKKSASGNTLLLQNPHMPWQGEYTLFESELTLKGESIYGVSVIGLPGISIGFNQDMGWTATVNNINNGDTYNITLKDDGYLLDGKKQNFSTRDDTLLIKQPDGALSPTYQKTYYTVFGPVVKNGKLHDIAVHLAGFDRPQMLLELWKMANSRNLTEFQSAVKMMQVPYYNFIYADRHGDIFYICNGLIPKRAYGGYYDWHSTIEGNNSKNTWQGFLSYNELPQLKNPKTGWLQNANDPSWTVTLPRTLNKKDYPDYVAPDNMGLRSQQGVSMLMADDKISFEKLVADKQSTHVLLADRVLNDLLSGIGQTSSPLLQECKQVLSQWDRNANNDSKGMLLFYAWSALFDPENDYNYAVRWDNKHPNTTPYGIRDKKWAVQQLERAAQIIKDNVGNLATPWGEYLRLKRNNIDLPANGGKGQLGIYRVATQGNEGKGTPVVHGDAWTGVIEFGPHVKAKVLLSYGNSSQSSSPHNGDQLSLFSEKKLRDAWFYPEQLKGNIAFSEIKKGNTFIKP